MTSTRQRFVIGLLVFSFLMAQSSAFAQDFSDTPELRLLEGLVAINGSEMDQKAVKESLSEIVQQYANEARPEDAEKNLIQAAQTMGIGTVQFEETLHKVFTSAQEQNSVNPEQVLSALSNINVRNGAQFSSKTKCVIGKALVVAGVVAFFVALTRTPTGGYLYTDTDGRFTEAAPWAVGAFAIWFVGLPLFSNCGK